MARLLLLLAIIAALAVARKSKPGGNKNGSQVNATTQLGTEPSELVVATYNIQTGKDLNGRRNLIASAHVITQADLVGIQEVYAPSLLNILGLGRSQTETLAKHGKYGWLFCATRRRWLKEHRGNAILSRLPIDNPGKIFET